MQFILQHKLYVYNGKKTFTITYGAVKIIFVAVTPEIVAMCTYVVSVSLIENLHLGTLSDQ